MNAIDHLIPHEVDDDMTDLPIGEQMRKERLFLEKFDWTSRQKHLGATQKAIIDALYKRFGLKLSSPRFNALYEAEEKRRGKEGDVPQCPCCGSRLSSFCRRNNQCECDTAGRAGDCANRSSRLARAMASINAVGLTSRAWRGWTWSCAGPGMILQPTWRDDALLK
ncbi:hypothetical protein [Paraburkholderia caribensis]|uniref:hypothetical protein n=1 Tax=Paraburkholderia caribensis TaxID=75105 RepID=UPI0031D818EB